MDPRPPIPAAGPSPAPAAAASTATARAGEPAPDGGAAAGGPVRLAGERLIGADLSGRELAAADLSGADLSRARLSGANLFGANLSGATLFETDLSGAELSGADLSGANLEGADLSRAGLGLADLHGANLMRSDLSGATLTEARLHHADLRLAKLDRARARGADVHGADFTRASLQGAVLDEIRVESARFDGADLRGASLAGLRGYEQASWLGADLREIDFTGAYLCRSFILDQNYIEEFKRRSKWSFLVYELWRLTSDCGRSATRWAFCTTVIVIAFAWLYTLVGIDYGAYPTPISPLYYSVVTLTTLGYGEIVPASMGGQIVAMVEVFTGYVMLGGLLSIFSKKMASRAE